MSGYRFFRIFLKTEGCEEAFDRAFYDYNDCTHFSEEMWGAMDDHRSLFLRVFSWKRSLEGELFWRKIDAKWQNIYRIS